jgi:hypothetical protein
MPLRKVTVPPPITLTDPLTGQPVEPPNNLLTFHDFLVRLFNNPLWNDSYQNMVAQRAIADAFKTTESAVTIAEDDWELLERAVQKPQIATPNGTATGFGFQPWVAQQLLEFCDAIVKAARVPKG